ncbi:hypothetical protein FNV43_RR25139 [Rhamnella rubrinervis]|uniref:Uncharacterized protein n=1 Tax=Rhamnella rubrinervis TaxID=2594499 RepID=A0A8K0GQW4_9ROSA|nr:hypothetical protein FNV43_RR25139 [Rhamnella rubrinervis]
MDEIWFTESNYVTRRFVFNAESIAKLRAQAKSESVPKPSRISGGSPRTSVLAHEVNLRRRMKPQYLLESCAGNLFWWGLVAANPDAKANMELHGLVGLLEEALALYDDKEFLESLSGEDGFSAMSELFNQQEAMINLESENPVDILGFTSWIGNSFFNELDFGWGKPYWLGVMGKVGPEFRNLVILVDFQWGRGIEAWVNLEEKLMGVLENDPNFLSFASPNPSISSL